MPRTLSPLALSSSQALETGEVWLMLLEIDHDTLTDPYRLVNNTANISSKGNEFTAYPFDLTLGADDGAHLPVVQLKIDNVDQLLIEMIRKIKTPPIITIRLVIASQPNTVELEISGMELREVSYNAFTITGTLYAENLSDTRYPRDNISPASGYVGLFR